MHHECERTKRWILFFPITTVHCVTNNHGYTNRKGTVWMKISKLVQHFQPFSQMTTI